MAVYIATHDVPQLIILDFLILPELKVEAQVAPDNQQIAVEFDSCSFIWGDTPEIPLEAREKEVNVEGNSKQEKP
ncbi:MAG: hypothetical protein EZS28_055084 [Streblomastix strix]|uniref:Uncharacterized protein n=1 Tax=Streblomastix strix TaxID=222440 RepID=A0A5J4Q708_9EUKA|nr:MAG: hypothetical protein EZS28_055084 [Streblomastix strix]